MIIFQHQQSVRKFCVKLQKLIGSCLVTQLFSFPHLIRSKTIKILTKPFVTFLLPYYHGIYICIVYDSRRLYSIYTVLLLLEMKLTRAPLGGAIENPLFFLISAKLMKLSTRNFEHLSEHQLFAQCANQTFLPTIIWPGMTSEWHVRGGFDAK